MDRSERPARGFTLVELLVVIGIIAVLIGILLPTISAARKRANTTACMATMRNLGQMIAEYQVEFKGSYPYSYYTSSGPGSTVVGEQDGDATDRVTFVWWSVLRKYMRRGGNFDNSTLNSDGTRTTRFMPAFNCPTGLNRDAGCDFGTNMAIMPDLRYETLFYPHQRNKPVRPAAQTRVYPDSIVMWDAIELPPRFDKQYVCGYDVDRGLLADPKTYPEFRYRGTRYGGARPDPDLDDEMPIHAGPNVDDPSQPDGVGNIRWRHGRNDEANFLFADGTVKTMGITRNDDTPLVKGDVKRFMLRIKWPAGFTPGS